MYRALYLAKRHSSLTLEDFPERWRAHSRLAGTLPGLRGYFTSAMQCTRLAGVGFPHDASDAFDGVALIGLRDIESAQAIWERPESRDIMQPDELKVFSQLVIHSWMVTEELTLRAGPRGDVAVFRFLRRKASSSRESFLTHMSGRHAELLLEGDDTIARYVQSRIVAPPPPGFAIDLISQSWFLNEADAKRHHADTRRRVRQDAALAAWIDPVASFALAARVTFAKPRELQ